MPGLVVRLEAVLPPSENDFVPRSALALEQASVELPQEGNLEMAFVRLSPPLACHLLRSSHHYLGLDKFSQRAEPNRKSALIG